MNLWSSLLNRRDLFRLLAGWTLALAGFRTVRAQAPATSAKLQLSPELTEGPYYIGSEKIRRDITEGKPGLPLRLRIRVETVAGAPLPDAAVDVWHCDAQGVYSGFDSHLPPPGGGPGPGFPDAGPGHPPTEDEELAFLLMEPLAGPGPGGFGGPGHDHKPDNALTFLRGVQVTDTDGMAEIDTIYPGWYMGRATHLHVRIHVGGRMADGRYRGGRITHTGQIFPPENVSDRVYRLAAYEKKETGRTPQRDDDIFQQGGAQVAPMLLIDPARFEAGFISHPLLVVDPAAQPPRT
jgi:protocatechuate 3,4-dioxygenase beta subunit